MLRHVPPVRLVAFDPWRSMAWPEAAPSAQHLHHQGETLRLMLSLEMLGYCNSSPNSQRYPSEALQKNLPLPRATFIALIASGKLFRP